MDKLTKGKLSNNQASVVLITLAIVVWVVGLIISKSVLDIILFNNHLIGRKREVDSTLQSNLNTLDELKSNFHDLETQGITSARVIQALPDKADVTALASRMEALLANSTVNFESFGVDTPPPSDTSNSAPGPQQLSFTIQISGPLQNIKNTLSNFEREITPMRITGLSLSGTEQNAQATLKITSYYQDKESLDVKTETLQ